MNCKGSPFGLSPADLPAIIPGMSFKRMLGISFVISLAVWAWFSWPLPRYCASGIPVSAHHAKADIQRMVPGDHLQFMYYCRLAGDMAVGKTPLFYNLYEFNTGNDRERFEPDAYYIPFSLIYAAGAALGGQALGWNLAGFISIWLTFLLTWLLVRRWTREACPGLTGAWIAVATALLGIILPFRWINLFGGSPAGFAMAWIPAILLGVDMAVREDRVRGGVLAGFAILMAAWGDQHVFFFGTLAAPVWGVVAFAARPDFQWRRGASYVRLAVAVLPIALFAVAALLFPFLMKWLYRTVTGLAPVANAVGPRTLREILLFSPDWRGFFGMNTFGVSPQIYLGVIITAIIAAGWLVICWSTLKRGWKYIAAERPRQSVALHTEKNYCVQWWRAALRRVRCVQMQNTATGGQALSFDPVPRMLLVLTLLGLTIAGIAILALGLRGPHDGLLFRIGRALIPPYAMIRQPAKIFCLMPSFLAVASALALMALVQLRTGLALPKRFHRRQGYGGQVAQAGRIWRILLPAFCAGLLFVDYARQTHPTISLLKKKQDAYAAVAADAAAGRTVPRALVLPLWPGDSHYASIYQYFAALYRVRMLDGYNPFIKQGYFENVFRRFESVNQGGLSGEQTDALLHMGVRYLILHENLFPEQVSPFPVTSTLRQLLGHPRLELLRQDGSVWAFKILDAPTTMTNGDFPPKADPFSADKEVGPDSLPGRPINGRTAGQAVPPYLGKNYRAAGSNLLATLPNWEPLFPTRRFEMEKTSTERRVTVKLNPAAGGKAYVALAATNSSLKTDPIRVESVSNLHWLVRARGQGILAGELMTDEFMTTLPSIPVQSPEWTWLNVPVPAYQGFSVLSIKLVLQSGAVDLDLSLLTAGAWHKLTPGESVVLPAPLFFHAGYIDLKSGSVVFRRDHDPQGVVLYGPKLPLPRGTYAVEIYFESLALPPTELGVVNLEQQDASGENISRPLCALHAGRPAQGRWRQEENLPFNLVLIYSGAADLALRQVVLTRLK